MARRMRLRPPEQSHGQLKAHARQYATLKHEERQIEAQRKDVGEELLPAMQEQGVTKEKLDFDEHTDATVAVKTRENVVVDPERLKRAVGAKTYNKLTSPVLDDAKIEAAISLGEVDPNIVASCTEVTETPYLEVRFTKKRKR